MNFQTRTVSAAGVLPMLFSLAAEEAETDKDRIAMSRAGMRPRSIVQRACRVVALVACVVAATGAAHAGPTSPLYLSTGTQIVVMQGSTVLDSWETNPEEFSIAVSTTVKTWSQGSPFVSLPGREYQLDGTLTGATFTNDVGCCFRDGTTDGQFNYAIRSGGASPVYRFNLDWTDPQVMPLVPSSIDSPTGIAYDPSDDTFWLASPSGFNVISVFHFTRTGQFITLFPGGTGESASLAYDHADDTLWVYTRTGPLSQLAQFATSDDMSKPNSPLNSQPGIGFVAGIEFQLALAPVPEPPIAALLGAGLAMVLSVGAPRGRPAADGR